MLPRRPGPSSTVSGLPVSATGSPGRMPDVSSYTWTTVLSPRIWMTSPMSCSVPTSTTSYMRGRSPIAVTTGPATRSMAPVPLMSSRAPLVPAATPTTSLEQIDADRPFHLRPEVLVFRRADPDDDRARHGLEPPPHRMAQGFHVRGVEDEDPDLRVVQELSEDVRGKPALLPACDDPDVLDLAVLPHDEIEDRQDRQRMQVRVSGGLDQMDLLDLPEERADPGRLDPLEVAGDRLVEGRLGEAAHQGRLVQRHHLLQVLHGHLAAARQEDLPLERRLRGPHPKEGLEVHDVDLPLDELPHQAVRLRRRRDRGEEFRVVDRGDAILPRGPVRHLGRLRPEAGQGLRVDRVLEPPERLIERLRFDQLAQEREGEAPGGHEVLLDFRRRRAVRLRPDDRLHVLQVVSVQVPADDGPQIAFAEIVDLVVHLREVPRDGGLDEVHARVAAPQREHLRLVLPFAEEPRDLRDLHLQEPSVHVFGQQGRPLRADPRRDVRVVARLVWDALPDPAVPLEERFEALDLWRPSPHALEGHRVSATSLTASSHTSRRIDSYRKSIRRVPSADSITTPPAQSMVPANAEPTIFRTTGSSRPFAYTLPPRHSASLALRTPRRNSA